MRTADARTSPLLQRVADALGCPVETLCTDAVEDISGGASECLRIWDRLTSDDQRRRALDALRAIADGSDP